MNSTMKSQKDNRSQVSNQMGETKYSRLSKYLNFLLTLRPKPDTIAERDDDWDGEQTLESQHRGDPRARGNQTGGMSSGHRTGFSDKSGANSRNSRNITSNNPLTGRLSDNSLGGQHSSGQRLNQIKEDLKDVPGNSDGDEFDFD
jgi:hypothetical protein